MYKWNLKDVQYFRKISNVELAQELGIAEQTVCTYRKAGYLPKSCEQLNRFVAAIENLSGKKLELSELIVEENDG